MAREFWPWALHPHGYARKFNFAKAGNICLPPTIKVCLSDFALTSVFQQNVCDQTRITSMPSREEGKDLRRRAIVKAARALIRDNAETGFSMRALAERAGLSLVTPYNLFGSKQAVLQAVLDEDIEVFSDRMKAYEEQGLDIFFEAVRQSCASYADDPEYSRAVLGAIYFGGTNEYRTMFRRPRRIFWQSLVEKAIETKCIDASVDPNAFSINLVHIYWSNIIEWVAAEGTIEEMETRTMYGFALSFLAVATPKYRADLKKRLVESQEIIKNRKAAEGLIEPLREQA